MGNNNDLMEIERIKLPFFPVPVLLCVGYSGNLKKEAPEFPKKNLIMRNK